ncbi:hypothetical protein BKA70DRAFT_1346624 [Coprinopsis sp. MPI-PUGE-AT-0042]|nr:hypothetical protein BKA70DRAFT_1346624 [Coprinopsis sp. MPI-PUGE-AT-0042]
MERSPHLGRYIKTLTITLPRGKKAIRILGAALLLVSKCLSCLAEVRIVDQDADEDSEDKTLRALDLLPDPKFGLKEWRKAASTDEWYTLSLALVSVARLAKSLFLKNLRVSGTFFTTCRQLENLALANVTLHSNRDWAYEPSDKALLVGRIPLKSLKLDAESLEDFGLVLDYAQIHDLFPIEFSHLEKLSLPVPIVERQSIRRDPIQADIMDLPIALKELHLWSISRIEPLTILQRMMGDMYTGQSTGFLQPPFVYFKGLDSPLRWLNTSSYETLTKLTFESRFRLCAKDDVIEDPYLGLFQGKSFAKLVQLEELVLTVWISGERYEEVNEAESFGNQWLVLDHAITPILDDNERTTTPHTHLRALKLTFGLRNICKKEDANHLFEVVSSMVFDRLHGLKALQKQGNIDLATECVAIADCPCGGAEPCDFHFREPRE